MLGVHLAFRGALTWKVFSSDCPCSASTSALHTSGDGVLTTQAAACAPEGLLRPSPNWPPARWPGQSAKQVVLVSTLFQYIPVNFRVSECLQLVHSWLCAPPTCLCGFALFAPVAPSQRPHGAGAPSAFSCPRVLPAIESVQGLISYEDSFRIIREQEGGGR